MNDGHCWDPLGLAHGTHFYHWAKDLAPNFQLETILKLFSKYGFVPCEYNEDGTLEAGVKKIAIYADAHEVTHVARQLPNGNWTSKLGSGEDIEHEDLSALEGDLGHCYGKVVKFVRKEIT